MRFHGEVDTTIAVQPANLRIVRQEEVDQWWDREEAGPDEEERRLRRTSTSRWTNSGAKTTG